MEVVEGEEVGGDKPSVSEVRGPTLIQTRGTRYLKRHTAAYRLWEEVNLKGESTVNLLLTTKSTQLLEKALKYYALKNM